MSSSLQDLLAQEGFRRRKPSQHAKPTKPQGSRRRRSSPSSEPAAATPSPASLCRDRRSVDLSGGPRRPHRHSHPDGSPGFAKPSSAAGSNPRSRAAAATGGASSWGGGDGEPEVRAVVSILSGYVGRFSSEAEFRRQVRERSSACLAARRKGAAHAVLVNLEMGMEGIERLAEKDGYLGEGDARDSKIRSLRNSIRLLTIVASVNSPKSRNGYTCGVPNSYLSACAQLYLSIVYRMEGDDWVAARHLLQVFCDAPYLARKNLLPDLWEHFFLPHLLHLEVWFNEEAEMASGLDAGHDRERRTKWLSRVYNDQMDLGTAQFALYYKEWLKAGARAPVAPLVSLPHVPSCWSVAPKRSVSLSPCSVNRNLYQAVFGPSYESKGSEDGALPSLGGVEVEREAGSEEGICKNGNYVHSDSGVRKRLLHHAKETPITESVSTRRKSYSFLLLSCRGDPNKGAIRHSHLPKNGIVENLEIAKESNLNVPLLDLGQAITLMSTSDNLSECEYAIRVIAKVWLDANGDPIVETALSTASVIEGLLEVSFTSKDEEVVELTISILAELVARSEVNKQVVLNADPQLEIFLKLLRVHSLFLKVAVLLFLLKPKAKQMLSLDWVPIVLRILEYGDQRQTLFTVQCRPKSAAFYFLDQLLKGFDVDRNVENGKQVVAFGGLRLLIRRLELGDARERKNVASLLVTCVRADGSCREYLATNVKKTSILELLIGNQLKSSGSALSLLLELVRLRRTQVTMFLNNLKNEGCLNAMHILLVLLQRAPDEQRPLVAAILLQLDLLGDPLQFSVYREEGIDALIASMDCNSSKKVQENCNRALFILGGRFLSTGEASLEAWLLKKAGFDDVSTNSLSSKEIIAGEIARLDEEEAAIDNWQRTLAGILLNRGNKRFFTSLSNCIADGIPSLARSCLVTVAWTSIFLSLFPSTSCFWSLAWSVLTPRLLDSLNYDRPIEERVIASLSLHNLTRNSEYLSKLLPLDEHSAALLRDLVPMTWTAREILLVATTYPVSFVKK